MLFGNGQEKDRRSQEESTWHISVLWVCYEVQPVDVPRHFRRVVIELESELFQLKSQKI